MTRSDNIKAALAELKAEGETLGRPDRQPYDIVKRIILERYTGKSYGAIAAGLNADGIKPAQKGKKFYPSTIERIDKGEPAKRFRAQYKGVKWTP